MKQFVRRYTTLSLLLILLLQWRRSFGQTTGDEIIWLNQEKEGHIEIYKSGNMDVGKPVWIKNQNDLTTGINR
ncbi:DUF2147 domain-containing protein [Pedobacter hartonius]|uniref:Uncharacterized protein n=1 Tax=Pedobacter hartonius TaxID=425514 RepID=A0A1H4CSI4_9SPHI|nr:hypothetical protein [Pedobacter hartonius]SEA63393.1 hypothetical protein SAMN05443550_104171 [Pedobacter hartonius]